MSYGSYGVAKGLAPVRSSLTAAEVFAKLQQPGGGALRLLDVRDGQEYQQGTLPGAAHLGQVVLTYRADLVQPLLDAIVASSVPLLLIGPGIGYAANNVSRLGGTPQCVEFVAAYLEELGVSRDRFIRLEGGATAWVDAGHDFERPGVDTTALCSLHAAIVAAGLDAGSASSTGLLGSASLGSIERLLKADGGRAQLLELFKAAGFALKERQKLANFLAKAHRDGRLVVAPEVAAPPEPEPEPAQAAPANVTDAGALAPAPAPPVASEAHQAQAPVRS